MEETGLLVIILVAACSGGALGLAIGYALGVGFAREVLKRVNTNLDELP